MLSQLHWQAHTLWFPRSGGSPSAASPLAVVEYQLPREGAFPHDPAVGSDGIVWYTDQQNSFIGRLDQPPEKSLITRRRPLRPAHTELWWLPTGESGTPPIGSASSGASIPRN